MPTTVASPYTAIEKTSAALQWKRIGVKPRAGVVAPLFSIYSKQSAGIGDFRDLRHLIDWCAQNHLTLLQLLPLNDMGYDFRPYDAHSGFALDPLFLPLDEVIGVKASKFQKEIKQLKKNCTRPGQYVDYGFKKAKLKLLQRMYESSRDKIPAAFPKYCRAQSFWLQDYALFRALCDYFEGASWEQWPEGYRSKNAFAVKLFAKSFADVIQFYMWLQWQLYESLFKAHRYASRKKVLLVGDMPFLISRHSACVWAYQEYFKLDFEAGAPPDLDYAKGQRWGMPPYHWPAMEQNGFDYLKQKLKYYQNFYDVFRIDHVVGMYRLWAIDRSQPLENEGQLGAFDPPDESKWEAHGRKLLALMLETTSMLPYGEDLGTVPYFNDQVMKEMGIPGMDIQRWKRRWDSGCEFLDSSGYRILGVAALATHDTSSLAGWWRYECGTVNARVFESWCRSAGLPFDSLLEKLFDMSSSKYGRLRWRPEIKELSDFLRVIEKRPGEARNLEHLFTSSIFEKEQYLRFLYPSGAPKKIQNTEIYQKALERILDLPSIFSIQLLQDWLSVDPEMKVDNWDFRINFPGTVSPRNWALKMPVSLESLKRWSGNKLIKQLVQNSKRA